MTGEDPPLLSVVIAATDSPEAIDRALQALEDQGQGRIEVIVVVPTLLFFGVRELAPAFESGSKLPHSKETRSSRRIIAPTGSGVPRLRRLGLEASRGRVVAFLEDSCLVSPGWADAWLAAFEDVSLVAASGVVEHSEDASKLDWAVVFCEYAPFLAPVPNDPPARLAGNNFAVIRDIAIENSSLEVHETDLLTSVWNSGTVRTVEGAKVRHVRRFGWRQAFGDRFRFGLEFGRLRTVEAWPLVRWLGHIAGPAIFAVQILRLSSTILIGNRRYLRRFFEALPITLALLAIWSVGEWLGWCLGSPTVLARRQHERAGQSPGSRPGRARSPRIGCNSKPTSA